MDNEYSNLDAIDDLCQVTRLLKGIEEIAVAVHESGSVPGYSMVLIETIAGECSETIEKASNKLKLSPLCTK